MNHFIISCQKSFQSRDNTWVNGTASLADSTYEQLCRAMYAYRFGTMDFLKLVSVFEEILQIELPRATHQNTEGEKE